MSFARLVLERSALALGSARLLLEAGDTVGASSRAYYSAFDAARAVLAASIGDEAVQAIKTHNGLWSRFSAEVVKPGKIAIGTAKALASVEDLRLLADYGETAPPVEAVRYAITAVAAFLEVCRAAVEAEEPP